MYRRYPQQRDIQSRRRGSIASGRLHCQLGAGIDSDLNHRHRAEYHYDHCSHHDGRPGPGRRLLGSPGDLFGAV